MLTTAPYAPGLPPHLHNLQAAPELPLAVGTAVRNLRSHMCRPHGVG